MSFAVQKVIIFAFSSKGSSYIVIRKKTIVEELYLSYIT